MKSKSPFAIKSPLLAYKSDMTGNYANPEYVPRIDVAAVVGAHAAKTAADVFTTVNEADKGKRKAAADKASGGSNTNNQEVNIYGSGYDGSKKEFKFGHDFGETNLTPPPPRFPGSKGTPTNETPIPTSTPNDNYNTKLRKLITPGQEVEKYAKDDETYRNSFKAGHNKNNEGFKKIEDYIKFKESKYKDTKQMFAQDYKNDVAQGDEYEVDIDNQKTNYSVMNMKGSPVKHNAETALADAKQNNFFARAGVMAQAISAQGGSAAGSIGQQIGNQAQQRAADAGGSTGVDPFLPPPNQVAETGSYGSGGDRDMLEMNGNQIDNQSIGRNTDITSQLFGSGQRASMLAMKGTPLHTEGHGGAKDHKHSPESRNSVIPKWKNGVNPYKTADKSISSIDEPRRLDKDEIGAPTEREQSDRDYLAKFDMEYKASGGNLYVPKKR